jgi:hypothetical protein
MEGNGLSILVRSMTCRLSAGTLFMEGVLWIAGVRLITES